MPNSPDSSVQGSPSTANLLAAAGNKSLETEFFNPVPPGYQKGRHKYVAVFGTVMSGLGKGIFSSSLAKLLQDKGLTIAPIKMEGYLNIDSGTLNPYRHGEVFVLDDGLETDMDLGTYERMLDQDLTRDNYTTSGQVYQRVLDKERHGGYLGRDVQMIPHVTGEVKYMLRELAMKQNADVVCIEVGGTVGDYENSFYIEALRELAFEEADHGSGGGGGQGVCFVALTYIIEPQALGEQKSKAAQLGLKKLLEVGVQPHIIACRARNPVTESITQKIAMFSNVPIKRVFSMHDRASIYTIPDAMREAGLDREILSMLDLHGRVDQAHEDGCREHWRQFVGKLTGKRRFKASVGITGKYASLRDAYASIDKALEHSGAHLGADLDIRWIDTTTMEPAEAVGLLQDLDAVIVPGGFGGRGTEGKIACIRHCRESGLPFLGICFGFQMAVIEYARHVCGLAAASTTEFEPGTAHPVIDILPEQKKIEGLGGNMRLGGKDVLIKPATLAAFLFAESACLDRNGQVTHARSLRAGYSSPTQARPFRAGSSPDPGQPFLIRQRFRHRYEVDPRYIAQLEKHGLIFSGRHPQQPIMQILELPPKDHPYFIGAQFHPELLSRPLHPHPMFMGLIAAAIQHAHPGLPAEKINDRWLPRRASNGPTLPFDAVSTNST